MLAKCLEALQSEDREAFDSSSAHACAELHAPVSRSLCGRRRDSAGRTLTWSGFGNVAISISLQGERLGGVGWGALLFAIKVSYCSGNPLPVCASFFNFISNADVGGQQAIGPLGGDYSVSSFLPRLCR